MRVLFVHQNFPGQYGQLSGSLAATPGFTVQALGDAKMIAQRGKVPGVKLSGYPTPNGAGRETHHYVRPLEGAVRRGQAVARALGQLKARGFVPDVIYAHPGWGEALFLKDVFPDAKVTLYCEFYYHPRGADVGFDPEYPSTADDMLRVRVKNATQLLSIEAADRGISPTQWQRNAFPEWFRDRIEVIHEGVDTDLVSPAPGAHLDLDDGKLRLTGEDEVVTYIARNLEPYRGFHTFMRALAVIQKRRPRAHTLVVGGNEVSYGSAPPQGTTYRELMLKELEGHLDLTRVHFLDRVPYKTLIDIYRISGAHVYLTYPFVLSWSMLEAMSAGCAVVASRTPPVEEVVVDRRNGLLVDFFKPLEIADAVDAALERNEAIAEMRRQARRTVVENYDQRRICLPRQLELFGVRLPANAETMHGRNG